MTGRQLDRRQLRTLVAVIEQRSFSGAARVLGTVQSNVSAHVARLERELGVELVDRTTTTATPEGALVVERARRIEQEFEDLEADVVSLRRTVSGQVRLGAIGTTARWIVPSLLETLRRDHPAIQLVVLDATTSSLVLGLTSTHLDVALLNLPVDDPELHVRPLFDEERVLVVPDGHPLVDRSPVSLEDLADHELLLEARGTAFRDVLDRQLAERGVELRAQAEFDGMRLLTSLAFGGLGAGIVPASAVPANFSGPWRILPVDGLPSRQVGLATRRRALLTAAQRVVIDLIERLAVDPDLVPVGIHPVTGPTGGT
jgi:LysR family hydrogen peroxide-inducible transcriptional activator